MTVENFDADHSAVDNFAVLNFPVAGVQMDVRLGAVDANLARMASACADPRVRAAELIVFPECATTGYCFDTKEEACSKAQQIPGPITDSLERIAKAHHKFLAFGTLERDGDDLFNCCVLLGPQGIVGKYRKIHLPYLGVDRFTTPGTDELQVHSIGSIRVGMHICYDSSFPEVTRVLALLGADLIILPTNWPPAAKIFAEHVPHARAMENHVYYLVVNRVGEEGGFRFIGHSKFCLPTGSAPSVGSSSDEDIVLGTVQPHIARNKCLVREPGKHVVDRMADRRPAFYHLLCQEHGLTRVVDE